MLTAASMACANCSALEFVDKEAESVAAALADRALELRCLVAIAQGIGLNLVREIVGTICV
jgi:hypothetical protein